MSVPILRIGENLIASLQAELTDRQWNELQSNLLQMTTTRRVRGAIIDVTGMEVVDSFAGRTLSATAAMLRLRGVKTVIAGIHPDVALSMVRLGLGLSDVSTSLDLEDGLALLEGDPLGGT